MTTKRKKVASSVYRIWANMIQRCFNKNNHGYVDYGGRGITVCDRWRKFENFLADMGERPSKDFSIDRIDNNGNYEPSNCRWADAIVQGNNRRDCRYLEYQGQRMTVTEWARKLGINRKALSFRVNEGWSAEAALTRPITQRDYNPVIQDDITDRVKNGRHARAFFNGFCKRGHKLSPESIYHRKDGSRECRLCIAHNKPNWRKPKLANEIKAGLARRGK